MESSLLTGDHLFVSKLAYGPRVPQTPLTVPFTHNVLPNRKESYSTLVQNSYRRLKGFGHVKRGDYVVFGFRMVIQSFQRSRRRITICSAGL